METAPPPLAIGALSRRTGCNIETIRYYERTRLLPAPARSLGGYRLYGTEHLKRLIFIRRTRALGFSIRKVRKLLELVEHRRRPCAEARGLAATHLADVRAKIAYLRAMERVLKETVARCGEGTGRHCPLIEALYRDSAARSAHGRGLALSGVLARRARRPTQERRAQSQPLDSPDVIAEILRRAEGSKE